MENAYEYIACFFSFFMGACIASFINVVVWRVPRGESVVSPPSHCPKCSASIKWYHNIPIISYLALRGRFASCSEKISPRYIFVESLGAVLFLAYFLRLYFSGLSFSLMLAYLLVGWVWLSLMLAGSLIDYDHKLLPDFVTVGGMVLGVLFHLSMSLFNFLNCDSTVSLLVKFKPLLYSLSGLAVGFGLLGLVRMLGTMAFKREAMGMGDVFLMGAIGAIFGPISVVFVIVLSSLFGSAAGLFLIALSKTKLGRYLEIPYGPFICLGCLVWMLAGNELVAAYLNFMRF